jgi:hypothetical protein
MRFFRTPANTASNCSKYHVIVAQLTMIIHAVSNYKGESNVTKKHSCKKG